jgi:putative transposase
MQIVQVAERDRRLLVCDSTIVAVGHFPAQTTRAIGSQYHERPALGRHVRAQHENLDLCRFVAVAVQTLFIEPGSSWENGYVESFNGKLRDELLTRETFTTLTEARILIERWRREYNTVRPHSALGYRPPAPEAVRPVPMGASQMSWALS